MNSGFVRVNTAPPLHFHRIILVLLITTALYMTAAADLASGADIVLQWDPSEGATGYVLHYGNESRSYDTVVDVGPKVQHTITGLQEGRAYFFAVTAYSAADESEYSAELVHEPHVNQPPTANAGQDQTVAEYLPVTLDGTDSFDPDDGIKVLSWEQITGPPVQLSGAQEEICRFTAPAAGANGTILVFALSVQDYAGLVSTDRCAVAVEAPAGGNLPDGDGGPVTAVDTVEIIEARYREAKHFLALQASSDGDRGSTILTAWAEIDGQRIILGDLRYHNRRGHFTGFFRKVAPAPDRVLVTSSNGGQASSACTLR